MNFTVGRRHIGKGSPCFIIAEVGLAHDGSLTQAHAYIDAIKRAGADAAKFQCHLGDPGREWRIRLSWARTETRQEYWARTGFTSQEWRGLKAHCDDLGLVFMCSPFSLQAAEMLDPMLDLWKVPSGQVSNDALLSFIGATRKPVLLSTGMSTAEETIEATKTLLGMGSEVGLMQCTSLYPCPADRIGLGLVSVWGGLSDHSGTIWPGIAAAALGCQALEVHVCFSVDQGGLDTSSSITTAELCDLVSGVRFVERAMIPVDKGVQAEELSSTREIFMVNA
jgi:N-acetylneuraminate synthase